MIYVTPEQIKRIEAASDASALSYSRLMDNAAAEVTRLVSMILADVDVSDDGAVFLCGHGNNGADGFTAAKNLADASTKTVVILADGEPKTELAVSRFAALDPLKTEIIRLDEDLDTAFARISNAAVIVDAVYGVGFKGDIMPPLLMDCFNFVRRCNGIKIAVDVPSGCDALNGMITHKTLKYDYTVTFGYKKLGMLLRPLRGCCGEIIVADIGLDKQLAEGIDYIPKDASAEQMAFLLPKRKYDSSKGGYGKLLNIAGSACMSGAAALSTFAALRSGVGVVRLASTDAVINRLASSVFEATYLPLKDDGDGFIAAENADDLLKAAESATAVTIGCGLGVCASTRAITRTMIEKSECPVILDADGINCLSDNIDIIKNTRNKLIVTPHAKELNRLAVAAGIECARDRYSAAVALAEKYDVVVVAKGVPTFVVGNGKAYVCVVGNSGLSKGGSGDVLTGIIGAFAAQGVDPLDAALSGVFVHGLAADKAAEKNSETGMLPFDVVKELPFVFKEWNR